MKPIFAQILAPKNRIWSHVLFWVMYLVYFSLMYGSFNDDYLKGLFEVLFTLPIKMAATYLTLYWLIPTFIDKERYFAFTIVLLVMAVGFGYVDRLVLHAFWVPKYLPDYDYTLYPLTHLGKAIQRTTNVYTVVLAAAAIKLIKRNYQHERLAQELNQQKLDAELKFLKAQIHPHFLFNTLNTLYSLTLQNSPISSQVVIRLSNLLDYMLYDCNVARIPLRKEVQQIQNLIELEKLRYGDRLDVGFSQNGEISNRDIPPLLLLPFIENAFKHGVSQEIEDAFISIDLTVKEEQLVLRVENSRSAGDGQTAADYTKGIGLRNVRRRLELIYGEHYELQVFEEEETFMIVLRIPLDMAEEPALEAKLAPVE